MSTGIAVNRVNPSHLGSGGLEDGGKLRAQCGIGTWLRTADALTPTGSRSPEQACGPIHRKCRCNRAELARATDRSPCGPALSRTNRRGLGQPMPDGRLYWCPAMRPTSDVQCARPTWIPRPEIVSPLSHDAPSFRPSAHARARFMSGESVPGGVAQPASMTAL